MWITVLAKTGNYQTNYHYTWCDVFASILHRFLEGACKPPMIFSRNNREVIDGAQF